MLPNPAQIVSGAMVVNLRRRLRRVVVEYPGGAVLRLHVPLADDINQYAYQASAEGLRVSVFAKCAERWERP